MKGTALLWSEVNNLSHEDESNMTTLEELMCKVWVSAQETEITANFQDEGDEVFNSLDPLFWVPLKLHFVFIVNKSICFYYE